VVPENDTRNEEFFLRCKREKDGNPANLQENRQTSKQWKIQINIDFCCHDAHRENIGFWLKTVQVIQFSKTSGWTVAVV